MDIFGENVGRSAAEDYVSLPWEERIARVKETLDGSSRWGFGRRKLVEFKLTPKLRLVFRLYDSPLYDSKKLRASANVYGFYLRGFHRGWLSKVLGMDVKCEETKCAADGYGYCEFRVSQASKLKTGVSAKE